MAAGVVCPMTLCLDHSGRLAQTQPPNTQPLVGSEQGSPTVLRHAKEAPLWPQNPPSPRIPPVFDPPPPEPRRVTGQGRPRSPKTVQSAKGEQGKEKRERIIVVVRSPCQENYPADAHPSVLKSVLESANPAWTRSVHLDAPGQRHGQQPVSGTADPGVVKQDKSSRGSVDTTKTRSGPQRVRMSSGERPIGAAKGKQSDTEALCQPPPPPPPEPSHLKNECLDLSMPEASVCQHQPTRPAAPAFWRAELLCVGGSLVAASCRSSDAVG